LADTVSERMSSGALVRPSNDVWVAVRYGQSHASGDAAIGSNALDTRLSSIAIGGDRDIAREVRAGVALNANDGDLGFNQPGARVARSSCFA